LTYTTEKIPLSIVRDFDIMDSGDPNIPPRFSCEKCGGEMYPEYYKCIYGQQYKITDFLTQKRPGVARFFLLVGITRRPPF
jgi:hypothetical protein